jgi:hypothetical protein
MLGKFLFISPRFDFIAKYAVVQGCPLPIRAIVILNEAHAKLRFVYMQVRGSLLSCSTVSGGEMHFLGLLPGPNPAVINPTEILHPPILQYLLRARAGPLANGLGRAGHGTLVLTSAARRFKTGTESVKPGSRPVK